MVVFSLLTRLIKNIVTAMSFLHYKISLGYLCRLQNVILKKTKGQKFCQFK